MNIIDIQDQLKNFSENQLIKEMQAPSGTAPQFLVLSEIQRRKRVRDDFSKREAANQQTVAQEAVAAAGVPMQGIAGMSEAMAPQSAASEGIGTIMPTSMRQASPEAPAMPMQEGGLVSGLFSNTERGKEISGRDYEIRTGKDGRKYVYKKGTNIMIGSADKLFDNKYDGGVLRAQQGAYFGGMSEEDIDLNDILDAIQSYESQRGRTSFGSPPSESAMTTLGGVGERSAYQLRPETLLDFGRGYESYQPVFPEITDRIGAGKDFANAFEAYKDPAIKAQVDDYLADPDNARDAAMGVLSSAYTETGDIDKAIMAYNAGLPGVLQGSQAGLPYLQGVKGQFDEMSDRRQFILGGIQSAMGPMAIRGLGEQYYGKGDLAIDAALEERGYRPEGMAVVTTEPATATKDITTPSGDVIESGETIPEGTTLSQAEAQANAIPSNATGTSIGGQSVVDSTDMADASESSTTQTSEPEETPDTKEEPSDKQDSQESNVRFEPTQVATSGIEGEIKKLQAQMEKDREQDKWLAIAQAGLALMSSDNPTLLGAAGEAGVEGLKAFREANARYQEGVVDLINARAKLKDGKKGITASSAVSRINKIEELLNPTDPASMPLSPERVQALEEERRYLMREILDYPRITA